MEERKTITLEGGEGIPEAPAPAPGNVRAVTSQNFAVINGEVFEFNEYRGFRLECNPRTLETEISLSFRPRDTDNVGEMVSRINAQTVRR